MKYEVIARRYRPRRFEEVVGQESVAKTLRGGIVQDRLAHAYLFAGPRGVGKTSMARIFAKAINCPEATDRERDPSEWGRPCDDCAVCRAIHTGQDIDVIEMDGASHRGIEDIRGLIEGVNRPATRGSYKVYLIDEVHMLTREAFNALLKTLEEPPPHVKFVFATTEAHKIPDTVLSRCQRFDFQPINEDAIARRLVQICEAEGRQAQEGLLAKIARYSKGGLRDSQSLLDQLMTYCEGETELSSEALDRLTGRVASNRIDELIAGLTGCDAPRVLTAVRECFALGADPAILLEQVIESLHEALRERVTRDGLTREGESADAGSVDVLIGGLQILLRTAVDLRASAYPAVAVEVALLKLARLEDPRALDRALERLSQAAPSGAAPSGAAPSGVGPAASNSPLADPSSREAFTNSPRAEALPSETPETRSAPGTGGGPPAQPSSERTASREVGSATAVVEPASEPVVSDPNGAGSSQETPSEVETPSPTGPESESVFDGSRLEALWEQILIEIRKKHAGVASLIGGAGLEIGVPGIAPGSFTVTLDDEFLHNQLRAPHRVEIVRSVVAEVTGVPWNVSVEMRSGGLRRPRKLDGAASGVSSSAGDGAAGGVSGEGVAGEGAGEGAVETPPTEADAASRPEVRQEEATDGALSDHPLVRRTLELFNGRLV